MALVGSVAEMFRNATLPGVAAPTVRALSAVTPLMSVPSRTRDDSVAPVPTTTAPVRVALPTWMLLQPSSPLVAMSEWKASEPPRILSVSPLVTVPTVTASPPPSSAETFENPPETKVR